MEMGILVIDIGMTNKKVAVYDEHLTQKDVAYKNFAPIMCASSRTGEELPCHDLAGMEAWFFEQIQIFAKKYPIKAISVTTHGATFVCVGKNGKATAPSVFYTYEPGESFQNEFYALAGRAEDLQRETHTPPFNAMINLAKGIFFTQKMFPAEYAQTQVILNFPQYWSYLLTGKTCYEQTFLACHTYLWKQNEHEWSSVAKKLGILEKLPSNFVSPVSPLGKILPSLAEKLGLSPDVIVTAGIHDSNSSLIPYLADKTSGDFILNSTGTWCVLMHPERGDSREARYDESDIGKAVLFNRSAFDEPVKTAIFLGGMENDSYVKLFQKNSGKTSYPTSDLETIQKVLEEKNAFVLPELVAGSGQFPSSKPGIFEDGVFYHYMDILSGKAIPRLFSDEKRFWAALVLSFVIQTETALLRAGLKDGTAIYTEGGFRKNKLYNTVLASVRKENPCYLTDISEATAAGSAMAALLALTGKSAEELAGLISIQKNKVASENLSGYQSYKEAWLQKAAEE